MRLPIPPLQLMVVTLARTHGVDKQIASGFNPIPRYRWLFRGRRTSAKSLGFQKLNEGSNAIERCVLAAQITEKRFVVQCPARDLPA